MKALYIQSQKGPRIFNLDLIEIIEVEKDSFDIWVRSGVYKYQLSADAKEKDVLGALERAFKPLYEGRLSQVLGIRLDLDLRPYEADLSKVSF